jgi:hypothetical protein
MENTEYKEPDTYGSYLRNRLSPFYNIICAIGSCKANPAGLTHEMLLNLLFNSVDDLWEDYKKIMVMSYDPCLDKKKYKR